MRARLWNEPKTIENDRGTLAEHMITDHGTKPVGTRAAGARLLEKMHAELHRRAGA